MKIGEIIEVDGVKYIAQNDNRYGCDGCSFNSEEFVWKNVKKFECNEHGSIIVKIPLELLEKIEQLEKQIEQMRNCENCNNSVIEEDYYCCESYIGCKNNSKWELRKWYITIK